MKLEFFPAADRNCSKLQKNMKRSFLGSAVTSFLKSSGSLLCSPSCLRSARSSIQYIAEFHSAVSHMHSSFAATVMSFVLSRWHIEDAAPVIGSLVSKIANKLFEPTCETRA